MTPRATTKDRRAEDEAWAWAVATLKAQEEWAAGAPERERQYNRPINKFRRWLAEMRRRTAVAWLVIRTGDTGEDCGDW